jgi:uncharacterized Ntn-hydrolase superfamily protein
VTFSIVARSTRSRAFGIAVASRYLAVGSVVPAAGAGVGALATQSRANPAHHAQGLALLETGVDAAGVVAGLVAADPQPALRQLGVVGRTGDGATYTGTDCTDWAGGVAGSGYAIQGNLLAGPGVVEAMLQAWLASPRPLEGTVAFGRRLINALLAGDLAGGDRRGRQSAALFILAGNGVGTPVDLRVDDHPDPVAELRRLLDLHAIG